MKKLLELPSQEVLERLFKYDPNTGFLYFKPRTPDMFASGYRSSEGSCQNWNSRWSGKRAFTAFDKSRPYHYGHIFNVRYYAHRVIWKLCTDQEPEQIDHIDGDGLNNSIENLRASNHRINTRNTKIRDDNSSGTTGVYYLKNRNRWRASIVDAQGHSVYLGSFKDKQEAIRARKFAEPFFEYHKNHGRVQ